VIKKYILLASLLLIPALGKTQVVAAGQGGNQSLRVGGFGSYFSPDYAFNNLYGVGAFVDYNLTPKLGAEGEIRFSRFNQDNYVHFDTYLVGPKYNFYAKGKASFYGKVLFGIGEFTFPYNAANGGYGVVAFGGGVDYRLTHKIALRGDYEYQDWPGFVGAGPRANGLTPNGVSIGASYRIF
jgi:opacity protein-like surface antigen